MSDGTGSNFDRAIEAQDRRERLGSFTPAQMEDLARVSDVYAQLVARQKECRAAMAQADQYRSYFWRLVGAIGSHLKHGSCPGVMENIVEEYSDAVRAIDGTP